MLFGPYFWSLMLTPPKHGTNPYPWQSGLKRN
jgi:hypothetical protein